MISGINPKEEFLFITHVDYTVSKTDESKKINKIPGIDEGMRPLDIYRADIIPPFHYVFRKPLGKESNMLYLINDTPVIGSIT